jgi:hypothetical protein
MYNGVMGHVFSKRAYLSHGWHTSQRERVHFGRRFNIEASGIGMTIFTVIYHNGKRYERCCYVIELPFLTRIEAHMNCKRSIYKVLA